MGAVTGTMFAILFSALALVELRPREDASEANPDALVAFALGRVFRARK